MPTKKKLSAPKKNAAKKKAATTAAKVASKTKGAKKSAAKKSARKSARPPMATKSARSKKTPRAAKKSSRVLGSRRTAGGKASSTGRSARKTRDRAVKSAPTFEVDIPVIPSTAEPAEAVQAETPRDPQRGAHLDIRNHSRPEVQLMRQHAQVMGTPQRRHTVRGH